MSWRPKFFDWLLRQLIVVEDWPYSGTDITGDAVLPLPAREDWDEALGKTHFFILTSIMIFIIRYVLMLIHVFADVDREIPVGMSQIARRVPHDFESGKRGGRNHTQLGWIH